MTVQQDQAAKVLQHATEAIEKGNLDYAKNLILDILRTNPDDVKARMTLRTAQKNNFEKNPHGIGHTIGATIAGFPNILAAWVALLFKKYAAAIEQYEKYLARDPVFAPVLWAQARALQKYGREDAAIVTLEFLRQVRPKHVASVRELAHIYERREDIPRATQRYRMVQQLKPEDIEASKKIHDLAAEESIQEKWEKGDSFQEKVRDKDKAVKLEQAQRTVRTADQATDAISRVMADIQEDPERPILWAELGDLERKRDDLAASADAYKKALELDPLNQLYLQKLMDVQLQKYDRRIEEAQRSAAAAPDDKTPAAKVEALKDERRDFWLTELKRRVEERPTETALRFNLGHLYYEIDRINESIAEFQRVIRDVKYKVAATAMLGKCFAKKGLDELAVGQLEKALQESNLMEDSGRDIAYTLGTIYERVGNYQAAEETYRKIFEIDIGYRDIADKMESVYRKRREKNTLPNGRASQ